MCSAGVPTAPDRKTRRASGQARQCSMESSAPRHIGHTASWPKRRAVGHALVHALMHAQRRNGGSDLPTAARASQTGRASSARPHRASRRATTARASSRRSACRRPRTKAWYLAFAGTMMGGTKPSRTSTAPWMLHNMEWSNHQPVGKMRGASDEPRNSCKSAIAKECAADEAARRPRAATDISAIRRKRPLSPSRPRSPRRSQGRACAGAESARPSAAYSAGATSPDGARNCATNDSVDCAKTL
mmetsp:Transcript_22420/g.45115  ORF Transcript_22420/g.45115 Transcript_22420/m.45115 type:complete len:245 (+) Transcript_22420:279-1013(+)